MPDLTGPDPDQRSGTLASSLLWGCLNAASRATTGATSTVDRYLTQFRGVGEPLTPELAAIPLTERKVGVPSVTLLNLGPNRMEFDQWVVSSAARRNPRMFKGPPNSAQVVQGLFGTCEPLATIGAIADCAPQALVRRMRVEGDLVEVILDEPGVGPTSYVIDNQTPQYRDAIGFTQAASAKPVKGAWWVAMLEKALAVSRTGGYGQLDIGASPYDGNRILHELTGMSPATVIAQPPKNKLSRSELHDLLVEAVELDRPVITGINSPLLDFGGQVSRIARAHNLATRHAYWVRRYDVHNQIVELGNPQGGWRQPKLALEDLRLVTSSITVGNIRPEDRKISKAKPGGRLRRRQ